MPTSWKPRGHVDTFENLANQSQKPPEQRRAQNSCRNTQVLYKKSVRQTAKCSSKVALRKREGEKQQRVSNQKDKFAKSHDHAEEPDSQRRNSSLKV